jgi:hypothetical protein
MTMTIDTLTHEDCLDYRDDGSCRGVVEYHSVDPGRTGAFPRCDQHWNERLDRRENSIERYENSDVAPDWFDTSACGERWNDDY